MSSPREKEFDHHPNNDLAQTRTTTHVDVSSKIISHRPSSNTLPEWGSTILNNFKDYLKADARTEQGQALIASTHGVTDKWEEKKSQYSNKTPITRQCYDLAYLIAQEDNQKVPRFGMNEGLHRAGAAIQALTGSKIDMITGAINAPSNMKYQDFVDCALINKKDASTEYDFQVMVQKTLAGECLFFDSLSNVAITWVSSPIEDVPIQKVLDAFKCISRQISDNKLTSARKASWVNIGDLAKSVLNDISANALDHTPSTQGHGFKLTTLMKKSTLAKITNCAEDNNDDIKSTKNALFQKIHVETLGIYSFLCQEDFDEYCKDPFDPTNETKVLEHFSFPAVIDPNIRLKFPYINSHKSLLQDPLKDSARLNTWSINAVILIPKVIHYLWADRNKTTMVEAASSSKCYQLSSYAARFHSNNFGTSSAVCHGAMEQFYDELTLKPYTSTFPNDIISAALFITDTINTALTHPKEWAKPKSGQKETDLSDDMKNAGLQLETIYSSMKSGLQVNDVIFNLGKRCNSFSQDVVHITFHTSQRFIL